MMDGVHYVVTAYVLLGGVLAQGNVPLLASHALFTAAVLVQWPLNGNRCILSVNHEDPYGYSKKLLRSTFGLEITNERTLDIINYMWVGIPLIISLILLWNTRSQRTR